MRHEATNRGSKRFARTLVNEKPTKEDMEIASQADKRESEWVEA
jgi:hypothetical protein